MYKYGGGERERKKERKRQVDFKQLAHTIEKTGKSEISSGFQQAGDSVKNYYCNLEFELCREGKQKGNSGIVPMLQS